MMNLRQAVFLDLNGTLVLPLKPDKLSEMTLISGADLAVLRLIDAGFVCPVITVQARIEKGLFTESQFRDWFAGFFGRIGLDLKGPYLCPHRYTQPCSCKKPSPLLYQRAAADFAVDLARSYVIGDTAADVIAARNFGGRGCLVTTGFAEQESEVQAAKPSAAFIGSSLCDVASWILTQRQEQ